MYSEVVGWIVESSIHVSVAVIFIMAVKRLFRNMMQPTVQYWIWMIVLARLIMPVSIESHISIYNVFEHLKGSAQLSLADGEFLGEEVFMTGQANEFNMAAGDRAEQERRNFFHAGVFYVWAAGMSLFLAVYLNLLFKQKKSLGKMTGVECGDLYSMVEDCRREIGIFQKVQVFECIEAVSPYVFGIFSSKLVVPSSFVKNEEWSHKRHVIMHELMHIKGFDMAMNSLFIGFLAAQWFNPLAWIAFVMFREDQELACDFRVIKEIPEDEVRLYGHALLDYASRISKSEDYLALNTGFVRKKQIERRVLMISKHGKFTKNKKVISAIAVAVLSVSLLSSAPGISAEESQIESEIPGGQAPDTLVENRDIEFLKPLEEMKVVSPYGERVHPVLKKKKMHTGVDLAGKKGSPIHSVASGTVAFSGEKGGYGNTIVVDHGKGLTTVYAQCDELLKTEGDEVEAGEQIAKLGSSGRSTGPHLHLEFRLDGEHVDPEEYIDLKNE